MCFEDTFSVFIMLIFSSLLLFENRINTMDLSFLMSFIFSEIGNDQTDSFNIFEIG